MKKTRQKKDHKKGQKERDNGMMADSQLTGSVKFASNYNWENVQKDCGFDRCNYNYNYNWENVWKGLTDAFGRVLTVDGSFVNEIRIEKLSEV